MGRFRDYRTARVGRGPRKCQNFHDAVDAGGRDVKIATIPSLDRFRAQPIWEMSVVIRIEDIVGENPMLWAKVQISADGINWIDEGTTFSAITSCGDYFVRVSHFGGWLRLDGEVQGQESRMQATIHLVLKE